ncbi:MAG: shikimate dehydrogenase [Pseudomonadota bacterium]
MSEAQVDMRPLTAGVMGWPIVQTKSPVLFDHWFAAEGIAGRYIPLAVRPEDFDAVYAALPRMGLRGVNVTVPHKEAALALAEETTPTARAIGAANMIRFTPEGRRIADNTDAYGFLENLRAGAPGWVPGAAPALVLGAGGAARAVVRALAEAGVTEIRLSNRTAERAEALVPLADGTGARVVVVPWALRAAALEGVGLLVNATSLGMTGKAPLEMPLGAMGPGTVVNDLVYAPLETALLAGARAAGGIVVDGLGMLLHQARPAFRAWFRADPTVDDALRAACLGSGGAS